MPIACHGPSRPSSAPRLDFLDGLRGLSALYVVLHHAALEVPGGSLSRASDVLRGLLRHGHFAVAVFIVLSGYCLMRPVALDPSGRVRGGWRRFFFRRARRILPPYYAALALCWLMIAVVPGMQRMEKARWDRALPAFEPGVVASHLFLVHNLDERWLFKIDPPMWSVATEWQIYLLFPGLIVVWRRYGIAAAVAAGFTFGGLVATLAGWLDNPALAKLCPWYAGLFAMGMAAAVDRRRRQPDGPPARGVALAFVLAVAAILFAGLAARAGADATVMLADVVVGLAAKGLVVCCARKADRGDATPRRGVLRLLESRAAVALGSFSYSLYLIHFPLLAAMGRALRTRGWGAESRFSAMILVATPLSALAAYLFHMVFERPLVRAAAGGPTSAPFHERTVARRRGPVTSPGQASGRSGDTPARAS